MPDKKLENQITAAIASIVASTDRPVSYRVCYEEDNSFRKRKAKDRIEIHITIEQEPEK